MKIITSDFESYRRKDGYFYIVYRVDDTINGKFYIGSHKTIDLNDNYYGTPGKNNDYSFVLKECKSNTDYSRLIFTVLKYTTQTKLYKDEFNIISEYKTNDKLYNMNIGEAFTVNHFSYKPGDKNNPFIKRKNYLSKLNTEKNKNWAGIYKFSHPTYGIFTDSITNIITYFKDKNIIIDRGKMNLIGRIGNLRSGWVEKGKMKYIQPDNKYYNWTCLDVIKKPTHTKY